MHCSESCWIVMLKSGFRKFFWIFCFMFFFLNINLFELVGDSSSLLRITSLKPTLQPFKFTKHVISGFKSQKFTKALASCLIKKIWVSASPKAPRLSAFEALLWRLVLPARLSEHPKHLWLHYYFCTYISRLFWTTIIMQNFC